MLYIICDGGTLPAGLSTDQPEAESRNLACWHTGDGEDLPLCEESPTYRDILPSHWRERRRQRCYQPCLPLPLFVSLLFLLSFISFFLLSPLNFPAFFFPVLVLSFSSSSLCFVHFLPFLFLLPLSLPPLYMHSNALLSGQSSFRPSLPRLSIVCGQVGWEPALSWPFLFAVPHTLRNIQSPAMPPCHNFYWPSILWPGPDSIYLTTTCLLGMYALFYVFKVLSNRLFCF